MMASDPSFVNENLRAFLFQELAKRRHQTTPVRTLRDIVRRWSKKYSKDLFMNSTLNDMVKKGEIMRAGSTGYRLVKEPPKSVATSLASTPRAVAAQANTDSPQVPSVSAESPATLSAPSITPIDYPDGVSSDLQKRLYTLVLRERLPLASILQSIGSPAVVTLTALERLRDCGILSEIDGMWGKREAPQSSPSTPEPSASKPQQKAQRHWNPFANSRKPSEIQQMQKTFIQQAMEQLRTKPTLTYADLSPMIDEIFGTVSSRTKQRYIMQTFSKPMFSITGGGYNTKLSLKTKNTNQQTKEKSSTQRTKDDRATYIPLSSLIENLLRENPYLSKQEIMDIVAKTRTVSPLTYSAIFSAMRRLGYPVPLHPMPQPSAPSSAKKPSDPVRADEGINDLLDQAVAYEKKKRKRGRPFGTTKKPVPTSAPVTPASAPPVPASAVAPTPATVASVRYTIHFEAASMIDYLGIKGALEKYGKLLSISADEQEG